MRVALVHYWLVNMRGGERVLEALCRMFPDADIYTHVVDRRAISRTLARHRIRTTFIARLPFARRLYRSYLPLMPLALESLDLTGYDLIISHEAGPAKGIVPSPRAVHLCYASSPMRYVWDKYHVYRASAGWKWRLLMAPVAHYLRLWDHSSAARVDRFIANSRFVAGRIGKYYRRPAFIVFPPVAVDEFVPAAPDAVGDYFLWVGELISYKRPEVAIEAFSRSGRRLVVVGEGAQAAALRRSAAPNVEFVGKMSFAQLKLTMAECRALIFPGEEDFGIIPVEVQAAGRPVIALGQGGAVETVVDGRTGILYDDDSVEGLLAAIDRFEASGLATGGTEACVANAQRFTEQRFVEEIRRIVDGMTAAADRGDVVLA